MVAAIPIVGGCVMEKQPTGETEIRVSREATETGERIAEGTREGLARTGEVLSQAGMTGKISSAIQSAGTLDIENLDVDTVDTTITLKGYAPNEGQQQTAGDLAQIMAGMDYTIDNQIAVGKP